MPVIKAVKRISIFLGVVIALQGFLYDTANGQEKDLQVQSEHELLISYQGRLTDSEGNPVSDGNHTIVFSLYDQETDGTALWKETQNLETSNGIFSAQLGSVNPIDTLTFNRPFYLGIEVDGGDELTPRTRLTTVPYAQRAHSVDDSTITTEKLTAGAVTTDKIGFAAVDSSRLDPDAVSKMLRPVLEINKQSDYVGINRSSPVTGNDFFSVRAPVGNDVFGGMYVDTDGTEAWPFYGYANDGNAHAWHLFDQGENEWILEFDFTSPRFRLRVTDGGVLPGGDGDIRLGNSSHRWSEVYAANGTIQTSDRRLKTDIEDVDYGLEEILKLQPVGYRWKQADDQSGAKEERHLGLIAQDVRKVVSEAVEKPGSEEGYFGMNYSELVPVLVKAIQEQQEQIKELQKKLDRDQNNRKAELEQLKKKVNRLAEQIENLSREGEDLTSASN